MISRRTVGRAIVELRDLGLLDEDCKPTYSDATKPQFWIEVKKRQEIKASKWSLAKNIVSILPDGYKPKLHESVDELHVAFERIEKEMRAKGYSQRDMANYWHEVFQWCEMETHLLEWFVFWSFDDVFALTERVTVKNRAKGKFAGRNALGQLRIFSKSVFDAMLYRLRESGWNGVRSWRPDLSDIQLLRNQSSNKPC